MLPRSPHLAGATAFLALLSPLPASDPFAFERDRMVREQIAGRGIHNREVLRVLGLTRRHLFVPKAIEANAYDDCALPLGYGGTISQPYIVALMTELLDPAKSHRVLEIGTGSGYQAAVLAQLSRHVFTIEIVPELAEDASRRLARLGYRNVTVRYGDGYQGWPDEAPFDRIILTAAPEQVPHTLLDQLAPAGRLVAPVGGRMGQDLILIEKRPDGTLRQSVGVPVIFVPMYTR